MGVRLVVEGVHLAVARAAVQRDGFFQGAVRLQADRARAVLLGQVLELDEEGNLTLF